MSLYLKYRPRKLSDVFGNQTVKEALQNSLKQQKIHHAILFCGPTGTGKTTLARILAMSLNCDNSPEPCLKCKNCVSIMENANPDYIEINAADLRGIDDVRAVIKSMEFSSSFLPKKVYVFDEAHQWTNESQNCILKTLEEPPSDTYIFLCTTDPSKLLKTVRSRCEEHRLYPLSRNDITNFVNDILIKENVVLNQETFQTFCEYCSDNPRELLTELSVLLSQNKFSSEVVFSVLNLATQTDESNGFEIAKAMISKDVTKIANLTKSLDKKTNFEGIRRVILSYAKSCLLGKTTVNDTALLVLNLFLKPLEPSLELEDFIYRTYTFIYKLKTR